MMFRSFRHVLSNSRNNAGHWQLDERQRGGDEGSNTPATNDTSSGTSTSESMNQRSNPKPCFDQDVTPAQFKVPILHCRYHASFDDDDDDEDGEMSCPICTDAFETGQVVAQMTSCCNQVYHSECLNQWLQYSSSSSRRSRHSRRSRRHHGSSSSSTTTCPMCRSKIRTVGGSNKTHKTLVDDDKSSDLDISMSSSSLSSSLSSSWHDPSSSKGGRYDLSIDFYESVAEGSINHHVQSDMNNNKDLILRRAMRAKDELQAEYLSARAKELLSPNKK